MNLDDNTLTVIVDAAAKGRYAEAIQRAAREFDARLPEWDELPPLEKNRWREAVMMTVWDAVAAMPDPRYAAWLEGLNAYPLTADDNPYPAPTA